MASSKILDERGRGIIPLMDQVKPILGYRQTFHGFPETKFGTLPKLKLVFCKKRGLTNRLSQNYRSQSKQILQWFNRSQNGV